MLKTTQHTQSLLNLFFPGIHFKTIIKKTCFLPGFFKFCFIEFFIKSIVLLESFDKHNLVI